MMVGGVLLTTGGILGVLIGSAIATTASDQIPIYCNQGFGATICETRADTTQQAVGVAVLVTACYEWDLAKKLPFLLMGDLSNGSALIQASSVFRTEPYK